MPAYPKRLIEVDLPIKRISAHARREKSIRHGHISTLHIWWARRPLAACRAVICASLWPDPADVLCPQAFRDKALESIRAFAQKVVVDPKLAASCHPETMGKYLAISGRLGTDTEKPKASGKDRKKKQMPTPKLNATDPVHLNILQCLLLDFIADFANWDNSTVPEYLETSRALTQAAHESLGGIPGTKPLVVDPFAGGGAIPLEALRVGADAFASDLNPVAVLLNKVVLEYIPKHGQKLADEVRKWGKWMKEDAAKELAEFYPLGEDGSVTIAYVWARTVLSEAPGRDAFPVEVPLLRSLCLVKGKGRRCGLRWQRDSSGTVRTLETELTRPDGTVCRIKRPLLEVYEPENDRAVEDGTAKGGSATCPVSGYTTPAVRVRAQLAEDHGGANSARLIALYVDRDGERYFRLANEDDNAAFLRAKQAATKLALVDQSALPSEPISSIRPYKNTRGLSAVTRIGCSQFSHLYNWRQLLAIARFYKALSQLPDSGAGNDPDLAVALKTALSLAINRLVSQNSSMCRWDSSRSTIRGAFSKQALAVVWDYAEANPFSDGSGNWDGAVEWVAKFVEANQAIDNPGTAVRASATERSLPDDSAAAIVTDPPYFSAIPYGDLSDFFYVWLRRGLSKEHPDLFASTLTPKEDELIVTNGQPARDGSCKDEAYFRSGMGTALSIARTTVVPNGIGLVVYAEGTTSGWEAILGAIIDGGWTVTSSWPIDTEMANRTQAQGSASLQSSVHIVCRPRENPDGSVQSDNIGDWRDVLRELPARIHEWMPRLAREGVVGADAIFACLGPALEIFSRYSRVEKASGEQVALREYLEEVWAAVSREALTMIFEGADASGFEEDARITAMWLWTLSTEANSNGSANGANGRVGEPEELVDDDEESGLQKQAGGFALEFDAARKIAQGLGVHLERLDSVVEAKGETARLLSVAERARHLFGRDEPNAAKQTKRRSDQLRLDGLLDIEKESDISVGLMAIKSGETTLDRIHQSMLLFSAGRSEALQRFLVEDGIGRDQRFWKLAQALSALYPKDSDEKRWVDGVLARKKGLGF